MMIDSTDVIKLVVILAVLMLANKHRAHIAYVFGYRYHWFLPKEIVKNFPEGESTGVLIHGHEALSKHNSFNLADWDSVEYVDHQKSIYDDSQLIFRKNGEEVAIVSLHDIRLYYYGSRKDFGWKYAPYTDSFRNA